MLFKENIPGCYQFMYPLSLFYLHDALLGLENTHLKLKSIRDEMDKKNVI